MKRYFVIGDKLLCFIPRTGSTSILQLVENKHYPHLKRMDSVPHFKIPSIIDDHKSELVSMFRNPVERFVSGCVQKGWTIEEGIEKLKGEKVDIHIRPQYTFLSENRETKLFRFPEQLQDCVNYLGLTEEPLPHLSKSPSKPKLTKKQTEFLIEYYKKDIEIFKGLK